MVITREEIWQQNLFFLSQSIAQGFLAVPQPSTHHQELHKPFEVYDQVKLDHFFGDSCCECQGNALKSSGCGSISLPSHTPSAELMSQVPAGPISCELL